MISSLFQNFDFSQFDSPDFKEDSVREVLILPLLQALGYESSQIVRPGANYHLKNRRLYLEKSSGCHREDQSNRPDNAESDEYASEKSFDRRQYHH